MKRDAWPRVGVVADDLTGSGDIGIMFAKRGAAVRILSGDIDPGRAPERLAGQRSDVIIIDTDSRFDRAPRAYEKVLRATDALRRAGCEVFYKKTSSVFRGNVGVEFDAMLDELNEHFGVAVAAFPKNGRVTRGGIHFVNGRPLAESEFARDPVHPRLESDLLLDLQGQTRRYVGLVPLQVVRAGGERLGKALQAASDCGIAYALCDAETEEDLANIARAASGVRVLLGSSALAEELARVWPAPEPFEPLAGLRLPPGNAVLIAAGSVTSRTRAQLAALEAKGTPVLTARTAALLDDPDAEVDRLATAAGAALSSNGGVVAVRSGSSPEDVERARVLGAARGLDRAAVSRSVFSLLARVVERALRASGCARLIVLGGDTSAAVCRQLGVIETLVLHELAPGLPSTLVPGPRPLLLLLKSGSSGEPDLVLRAVDHLRGLGAR